METCNTVCKQIAGGVLCMIQETETKLCDNLEEWGGEGDGKEAWEGGTIGIPMADSC